MVLGVVWRLGDHQHPRTGGKSGAVYWEDTTPVQGPFTSGKVHFLIWGVASSSLSANELVPCFGVFRSVAVWLRSKMRFASWSALVVLAAVAPASTSKLGRVPARGRPLIVEVSQPDPAAAWALDVEELSANLREAGATALLVPRTLANAVIEEQARARGDFPGPLPVLCEVDASDLSFLSDIRSAGADGVAVWCEQSSSDALCELVAAAATESLDVLAIATDGASRAAAIVAGVCAFPDASRPSGSGSEGVPLALGAWDGDDAELQRLRDAGFNAALLLDGCGGDIADGRAWCGIAAPSPLWCGSAASPTPALACRMRPPLTPHARALHPTGRPLTTPSCTRNRDGRARYF